MAGPHLPVPAGIYSGAIRSIPKEWDHVWFRRFLTDFAQKADTRNAIAGPGVSITGPGATKPSQRAPAVISANMGTMPIFTATTPGIVPASGGGTVNFLRADGSWVAIITSPVVWTLTATDRLAAVNAGSGQTGNRVILAGANAGQNTQISDIIALGNAAFSAGTPGVPIVDTNLAGTTIIGSGTAPHITQALSGGAGLGPSTIIGFNNLPLEIQSNLNTIVGTNVLPIYISDVGVAANNNVLLGDNVGIKLLAMNSGHGTGFRSNVVIGNKAASANGQIGNQNKTVDHNVIIGYNALSKLAGSANTGGPGVSNNVIIGESAGSTLGDLDTGNGSQGNIFIGTSAGDGGDASANVLIGLNARANNADSPAATANVGIGSATSGFGVKTGQNYNVVIGAGAVNNVNNNRCIFLGAGAGAGSAVAAASDQFLIETYDGSSIRGYMYGRGGIPGALVAPTGLVFGASTDGTNRDIPGTNLVKILNGSVTGVTPLGGGFFYSLAGNLHWVDTNGVDTQLTPSAGRQAAAIYFIENTDVWDETTYVIQP